jgi:hypothetical protein
VFGPFGLTNDMTMIIEAWNEFGGSEWPMAITRNNDGNGSAHFISSTEPGQPVNTNVDVIVTKA